MNRRREILIALSASAIAAPFASFAQQQGKVWRVGFLYSSRRPEFMESHYIGAFPRGMRDLGYIEGKNLAIEWRFADDKGERITGLAAELVQLKVDAIVAVSTLAVRAAQNATRAIPIVMVGVSDPVGEGFAKSLAHPGGNITGGSNITADISPKLVEMLLDLVPRISRIAVLANVENPSSTGILKNVQTAARSKGITVVTVEARTPQEVESGFSQMVRQKVEALIVLRETFLNRQVRQIADLAARHRLPAIAGLREYVDAGGLISYGTNLTDQYRRAASYVDKILKGAKPGDLPVEQPTKFELFINGKTAKTLGLKIPQSLRVSADKVIE